MKKPDQPKSLFPDILNERPEGMSFEEYKARRTEQRKLIDMYKRKGRSRLIREAKINLKKK